MEVNLSRARHVAAEAHGEMGQTYGAHPYTVHLDAVVEVLRRFGHRDPTLVAAGYLHDTLEDTRLRLEDITKEFGPQVSEIVDAVTDGEGPNRKARKERPYRLIPTVPGALAVKLADRIANIEAARLTNLGLLKMYRKEQPALRDRLYDASYAAMFTHIEDLLR